MKTLSKDIQYFKNAVFQNAKIKDRSGSLRILKDNRPIGEIKKNIPHIQAHSVAKKYIYGIPLSRLYKELRSNCYSIQSDLEKEMDWLLVRLSKFSKQINDFLKEKLDFERLLFTGEYQLAKEKIVQMNNSICFSLRSIENILFVEELLGGLEKNKELLSILDNEEVQILSSLFADFYSNKTERKLSSKRYNLHAQFVRNLDQGFQKHWAIKLNFYNMPKFSELVNILVYDRK